MKLLAALILSVWLGLLPAYAQNVGRFSSYHNGKRYDFNITQEDLDKTPTWLTTAEHPPLPARTAMAVTAAYLPKLVEDAGRWRPRDVTLLPMGGKDQWVYVIGFHGSQRPTVYDGPLPALRLVVLMDGRVVRPVVSEHKHKRSGATMRPPAAAGAGGPG